MKYFYRFLFNGIFFLTVFALHAQVKVSFENPPSEPAIFSAGVISTGLAERDFALSPDETEIFYTIQSPLGYFQTIVYMKLGKDGLWSNAELAPFAGNYSDLEPSFSPDGKRLYFSSNRPVSGDKLKDYDIWYVEKKDGMWSAIPVNIGTPVNTEANEFYPSCTKSGNLYFTASYKNGVGREDIFVAINEDGKFKEPVALDTAVNSVLDEFNAYVSPEEDLIMFTSYGRKDDMGRSDLYMSQKDATGKWTKAVHLPFLNSVRIDYCPFLSFDKKKLFFTSERNQLKQIFEPRTSLDQLKKLFGSPQNGTGDIYWVNFEKVLASIR